jgi:hypothetical protein
MIHYHSTIAMDYAMMNILDNTIEVEQNDADSIDPIDDD